MTYEELLHSLALSDERIIIMTAENRAAIRNLPHLLHDRFIDTGISEQTMVGMSAGLAKQGRIPVIHALATFLTLRAFEFIRTDIGIPGLPVKLVGGVPGILSEANGPTHQAIEDISLMRGIPTMNVFAPADEQDLLAGIEKVILHPQPYYIRYTNIKPIIQHSSDFEIGKAEIIKQGSDVVIFTYGALFNQGLLATEILETEKISAGLINMRTLKPVDEETILKYCSQSQLVVVLEDHFEIGGLYSIIAETLLKNEITCRAVSISFSNKWFKPALLKDVLEFEQLHPIAIAQRIINQLRNISTKKVYL